MDPISAVSIAAAVVQFLEVGIKVTKRLREYTNANPGDVPAVLRDIIIQLPLITKSLSTIKVESNIAKFDDETRFILHGVVLGCLKLAKELDNIATKISPKPGESLSLKLKKVLSSLKNENRVNEIDRGLHAYVQVLILHQVVNPAEVAVGPPSDTTYFEVKELQIANRLPRQQYMNKLHEAFRQVSLNQRSKPEYVVLRGNEGAGKTQVALEWVHEVHKSGHFRAIFWLDASSPASLRRGLERTAVTIRRSKVGTTTEKLEFLNNFLSDLWHTWLFVLDNFEPKAFEAESLETLLPISGHGAILVLTRTPGALDTVEIKVHKALTPEETTSLRHEVSDAIRQKEMNIIVDALANGLDPNSQAADVWQDERGPMVSLAAEWGFAEALKLFLEMGADTHPIKYHVSTLAYAAGSGDVATVTAFLEFEDKTGYRHETEDYNSAASHALMKGHPKALELLLKLRGDRMDKNGKYLARSSNNTNGTGTETAAEKGYLECLQIMLANDMIPDSNFDRACILSAAVTWKQVEIAKFLLTTLHLDPNEYDGDKRTGLVSALKYNHKESEDARNQIVKLLLDSGAVPNKGDGWWGQTPLHLAAEDSLVSTIDLLLQHGADPTVEKEKGENVLEFAYYKMTQELYPTIAGFKPSDPEAHRKYATRVLFFAARKGNRALALPVLKTADLEAIDEKTGETPLTAAIMKVQLPMARMLVRSGAKQQVLDKEGRSAIRLAAGKNMYLLIKDLVKAKDSPGLENPDDKGYTPLMIAAKARHLETVDMLLSLGADREAMNQFGETALDIAEESRNEALIALLEK